MQEGFQATWQIVYEPACPLFTEFKENYADYRPGRYYISPFDLYTAEGKPLCRFQGSAGFMARLL